MNRVWAYNGRDIVECKLIRPLHKQIGFWVIQTAVDGKQEFEVHQNKLYTELDKPIKQFPDYKRIMAFEDTGQEEIQMIGDLEIRVNHLETHSGDKINPHAGNGAHELGDMILIFSIQINEMLGSISLKRGSKFLSVEKYRDNTLQIYMLVPVRESFSEKWEFEVRNLCKSVSPCQEFLCAFKDSGILYFLFGRKVS